MAVLALALDIASFFFCVPGIINEESLKPLQQAAKVNAIAKLKTAAKSK